MTEKEWNNKDLRAAALRRTHRQAVRELNGTDGPLSSKLAEIGNLIREKRTQKALSIRALAKLAHVDFGELCRIEHGKTNLSISTLDKIATALNQRIEINLVRNKDTN